MSETGVRGVRGLWEDSNHLPPWWPTNLPFRSPNVKGGKNISNFLTKVQKVIKTLQNNLNTDHNQLVWLIMNI